MGAVSTAVRVAILGLTGLCIAFGALALAWGLLPGSAPVAAAHTAVLDAVLRASIPVGVPQLADALEAALGHRAVQLGLLPGGLMLLAAVLLPGRRGAGSEEPEPEAGAREAYVAPVEKGAQKKAGKRASALARSGRAGEAAELCFEHGLMDRAAEYFVAAGDAIRAAEIRHDQNRFIEAAELYLGAGSFDSAGTIFAQQSEWGRAAEAYLQAGNRSVAAEMFEKAEDWRRAAECYEQSDFPRHAAKAWVRCSQWRRAADCLERVVAELAGGPQGDTKRQAEARKLVRMAGDLYLRAGCDEEARAVLERGECWCQAAEIALRCGDGEKAAELFLRGHDAPRASKVLAGLGRGEEAERVLAEYHRDRGEEELAAQHFEAAGEYMAAGDLYRVLDQLDRAGQCYERHGEFAQAAEMFGGAGDRARAADCYEQAGLHAEAAECCALLGDAAREAALLSKAGQFLRAGEILQELGEEDEAIKALQQIAPEHDDFPCASAILGEVFRTRGMLSLALKKLGYAVAGAELGRENLPVFHGLARVHEASGNAREALDLYEKILAFDFHYADVEESVARCRESAARLEEAENGQGASSPLAGSQAQGRYKIVGKLGRGGMGIVYKAQDTVLDRAVAFKVLPDALKENPQALKNFLREAKSAAQLNHPNIVQVYDAGEQDDVYYIAMEYVDGSTLKEIVKHRGKISPAGIVHVLAQMCEGLAYAHEKKIVHRDIKTANTMWTRDRKAKIMDFGLARVIEEVRNRTTVVSGTPFYMSPEQTLGRNVDHRADLYSLGVTIFELATGTLPFREGNLPYHHVHTPAPDPRERNPEVPELLAGIIGRCLQKDPADRYGSAREILAELRDALRG